MTAPTPSRIEPAEPAEAVEPAPDTRRTSPEDRSMTDHLRNYSPGTLSRLLKGQVAPGRLQHVPRLVLPHRDCLIDHLNVPTFLACALRPQPESISGVGPFAVISWCGGVPMVQCHRDEMDALVTLAGWDDVECGDGEACCGPLGHSIGRVDLDASNALR